MGNKPTDKTLKYSALIFMVTLCVRQSLFAAGMCAQLFITSFSIPSPSPLFQDMQPIRLEITSDFKQIYKISQRASFQNSASKSNPKFYLPAQVVDQSNPARIITASIRARGNTSLMKGEASFPKLRLEINDSEDIKGSTFQSARNFRINTHVATDPKAVYTEMGRLNNENSPLREGLAFSLARALGLATPATRLADIHYVDTGSTADFTRHALLIETDKKMAERLSMIVVDANEFIQAEKTNIDPVEGAKFFLFHKLIGNDDAQLRVHEKVANVLFGGTYSPLWNTTLFKAADGKITPAVYDFDVSTFVASHEMVKDGLYNNSYFKLNNHAQSMFVTKFLPLRQKFNQAELLEAINFFKIKKEELYQLTNEAYIDAEGRINALRHLDTFFNNVDYAMNLNVIMQEKVPFFKDVAQTQAKLYNDPIEGELNDPGFIRPGTPVVVLGKEGDLLKVAILNINYDLKAGEDVVGYIPATAKIGKTMSVKFVGRIDHRDLTTSE